MLKKLKVLWIYLIFRIKRFFKRRDFKTIKEYQKEWKRKNKSDIIREMVKLAGVMNKNNPIITGKYKKQLRKYSKKMLIKALIDIKLKQQFGGRYA